MILADTSIWIDHFYRRNAEMVEYLNKDKILVHPLVIGELMCGYIRDRRNVLLMLDSLTVAEKARHKDVYDFIEDHGLMGLGLGTTDVHLMVSARLSSAYLWTNDKILQKASKKLGIVLH